MNELDRLRQEIDQCDDIITEAYIKRLDLVKQVGEYKKANNVAVLNSSREQEILQRLGAKSAEYSQDIVDLYEFIMQYSRDKQKKIIH